jgi:hypothetical protein
MESMTVNATSQQDVSRDDTQASPPKPGEMTLTVALRWRPDQAFAVPERAGGAAGIVLAARFEVDLHIENGF